MAFGAPVRAEKGGTVGFVVGDGLGEEGKHVREGLAGARVRLQRHVVSRTQHRERRRLPRNPSSN